MYIFNHDDHNVNVSFNLLSFLWILAAAVEIDMVLREKSRPKFIKTSNLRKNLSIVLFLVKKLFC